MCGSVFRNWEFFHIIDMHLQYFAEVVSYSILVFRNLASSAGLMSILIMENVKVVNGVNDYLFAFDVIKLICFICRLPRS